MSRDVEIVLNRSNTVDVDYQGRGAAYGYAHYGEDVYGGVHSHRVEIHLDRTNNVIVEAE